MGLKEVHFRGKTMADKTGSCHCFMYIQSHFFIYVWNRVELKKMSCYEKETMAISKVSQLFISKKMVEEHCCVHSIKICKGSSWIAALSLSFGIKGSRVLNITPYHFTVLNITTYRFTVLNITPYHFTVLNITTYHFTVLNITTYHFTTR